MSGDYLIDPSAPTEPDIEALEDVLAGSAYSAELDWDRVELVLADARVRARRTKLAAAGVAVVLAAAAVVLFVVRDRATLVGDRPTLAGPGCASSDAAGPWRVDILSGKPRCGGSAIDGPVTLAAGAWLETDAVSRARVAVAEVGELSVEPLTELRLIRKGPDEHRFDLRRGRIHASVDAPPRLFVVTTPNADAVDLGCEYDLEVAEDGTADLTVTGGSVSLEGAGRAIVVATGYRAKSLPSKGPTPAVPLSAPEGTLEAAAGYTLAPSDSDLATLLAVEGTEITATLVGLLPLTTTTTATTHCEQVHRRLIELSPVSFPWQQTDFGCHDIEVLAESWRNLLEQTW